MNKNHMEFIKAGITLKAFVVILAISLLVTTIPLSFAESSLGTETINENLIFSTPVIESEGDFSKVTLPEAQLYSEIDRAPSLPRYTKTYYLPFGAEDISVNFQYNSPQTMVIEEGVISPTPMKLPLVYPESPFSQITDTPTDPKFYKDVPYGEFTSYEIGIGRVNGELKTIVNIKILPTICSSVINSEGKTVLKYISDCSYSISYKLGSLPLAEEEESYDLLILTPSAYVLDLQPLVDHKEEVGLKTKLIELNDIYNEAYFEKSDEYSRDIQEEIKYFIYNAILEWDVSYVLAVGGFRTFFGLNVPSKQFPIRYIYEGDPDGDPGYVSDQYYSCCIKEDNEFAHWNNIAHDDEFMSFDDVLPDVYFGRLACRNRMEVRTCVDKIIHYETSTYGEDWFNKFLSITGDGFQDMARDYSNYVTWDTTSVPTGDYTIYAQSYLRDDPSVKGPIDSIKVTVDHTASSRVTFMEDDHLFIEPIDPVNQTAVYPGLPVAEIVVPQNKDILGNTDIEFNPSEAYHSENNRDGWGYVYYVGKNLDIKLKSYDPSPKDDINPPTDFASKTTVKIWINNSDGDIEKIFGTIDSDLYYEGEMECQLAHNYMLDSKFEDIKLWTSNGNWTGMWDVINEFSTGYGFVYFAGHGNPMSWGDHLPGIPGGRDDGMINGIKNFNMDIGWARYESEEGDPLFPMDHLTNGYKQPITLIGGCHNSMIDSSFMRLLADPEEVLFTILHGAWIPESFAWWLAKMPQGGAIATIGCSGLGYGIMGEGCITGVGGWINPEFFRVYSQEGYDTLGGVFTKTLQNFANSYAPYGFDRKTFEEWVLLGDPSLKIGGYPPSTNQLGVETLSSPNIDIGTIKHYTGYVLSNITNLDDDGIHCDWEIRVEGASPLGRYFGLSGTIFEELFRGRIFSGEKTSDSVFLNPGEKIDITSSPIRGFGHVDVNVSVFVDDELLTFVQEDGFILGRNLILYHEEE